jgi:hypothetical protein
MAPPPLAPGTVGGELILFGGAQNVFCAGDTWVWNSKTTAWTQLQPADSPSPRFGVLMVRDSTLKQVVLSSATASCRTSPRANRRSCRS